MEIGVKNFTASKRSSKRCKHNLKGDLAPVQDLLNKVSKE